MKLEWNRILFLDLPILLLGVNYILYNAFLMDDLKNVFRLASMLLLLCGWIYRRPLKVNRKEVVFLSLLLITLFFNGSMILNFIAIVLFSVFTINSVDIIVARTFKINSLLALTMIAFMFIGITNNIGYMSSMGRLRYTLGFENPNTAAIFFASNIFLLVIYKRKIKTLISALVMATLLFYYTDSRTSFLALVVFIFLEGMLIFLKNIKYKTIIGKISVFMIDFIFIINLLSVFFVDEFLAFDQLLSYRISMFAQMAHNSGIFGLIFGGTLDWVDNFYYMLLFQYGIAIYIFVAITTHIAIKKMISNGDIQHIPLLIGVFLMGTMESSLIRPEILIMLVVWKIVFSMTKNTLKQNSICNDEKKY